MNNLFGKSSGEEESEWLSVSDLMAGLMVIFLFIAIVFIRPYQEQRDSIKEIVVAWKENELDIYKALKQEFDDDLPKWNAEIEEQTLLVRFKSPDVLFDSGKAVIRPRFEQILQDFFPRYTKVLSEFKESLGEIRIEGHTSSQWTGRCVEGVYFCNMELSQERTRAVLQYAMTLDRIDEKDRAWLQPLLTANGLSSSRPRLSDDKEDEQASRRVEFRVRTKAREEIVRILKKVQ